MLACWYQNSCWMEGRSLWLTRWRGGKGARWWRCGPGWRAWWCARRGWWRASPSWSSDNPLHLNKTISEMENYNADSKNLVVCHVWAVFCIHHLQFVSFQLTLHWNEMKWKYSRITLTIKPSTLSSSSPSSLSYYSALSQYVSDYTQRR